jgi:hypothetical protein
MRQAPTRTVSSLHRRQLHRWAGLVVAMALLWAAGCGDHESSKVGAPRATETATPLARTKAGGLFVSSGTPNQAIPDSILTLPYVAGVSIRATWESVEPAEGQFDWSYLDSQLARAEAAGKLAILRVMAGIDAPQWVYDAGAQSIVLTGHNRNNNLFGQSFRIPVPWDPVLLDRWKSLVSALGERYNGRKAVYAVAMAGPTGLTSEMILPQDEEAWTAAGYSDERLVAAWITTIDAYAQAFRDTPFSLAVSAIPIPRHPGTTRPAQEVVAYGLEHYGSRLYVQGNWLADTFPALDGSGPYGELYQLLSHISGRTTIGFQIGGHKLSGQYYDPGSDEDPGGPTTDLGRAAERALAAGASYIELNERYFSDSVYEADLRRIALRLAGSPTSEGTAPIGHEGLGSSALIAPRGGSLAARYPVGLRVSAAMSCLELRRRVSKRRPLSLG